MSALSTMTRCFVSLLTTGLLLACSSASDEPAIREVSGAVVYDGDDRVDPSSAPPEWAALAAQTAVALIPGKRLAKSGTDIHVEALSLQQTVGVCADEPFVNQVAASECSAVLIDDDLVLTAGHCFSTGDECDRYAYVFDYIDDGRGVEIPESSVFGCRTLVSLPHAEGRPRDLDFAVVQLDRAPNRKPADLALTLPVVGDPLVAVGFPSGLPMKIDLGGAVLQTGFPRAEQFTATIDAFQGNSGGPIFDVHSRLLGILVAGAPTDYTSRNGCARARHVTLAPDGGEQVLRQESIIDALCALNYPSARLCSAAPRCGDGNCSPNEQDSGCSADCAAARCTGLDCLGFPEPPPYLSSPIDSPKATAQPASSNESGCGVGRRPSGSLGILVVLAVAFATRVRRR